MNIQQGFLQARNLIESGLATELSKDGLKEKFGNGSIFVACSDCDRFHGYFTDLAEPFRCRVHTHALNGGAILLDPVLPEKAGEHGEAIKGAANAIIGLTGIEGAKALKKDLDLISLLSHFPCGMAGVLGMEFGDVILSTLAAKQRLKQHFGEDEKILALISIDWRNSDREDEHERGIRTYAISLKNLEEIKAIVQ